MSKLTSAHECQDSLWWGLALVIFGAILYYGYTWPYAFIGLGVVLLLRGLWMHSRGQ